MRISHPPNFARAAPMATIGDFVRTTSTCSIGMQGLYARRPANGATKRWFPLLVRAGQSLRRAKIFIDTDCVLELNLRPVDKTLHREPTVGRRGPGDFQLSFTMWATGNEATRLPPGPHFASIPALDGMCATPPMPSYRKLVDYSFGCFSKTDFRD